MNRENAGYAITDVVKVGDYEIVIGEHPTAPAKYVCWYCKNGTDYFWGRYTNDRNEALKNLCERVSYELSNLEKPAAHKQKSGEAR